MGTQGPSSSSKQAGPLPQGPPHHAASPQRPTRQPVAGSPLEPIDSKDLAAMIAAAGINFSQHRQQQQQHAQQQQEQEYQQEEFQQQQQLHQQLQQQHQQQQAASLADLAAALRRVAAAAAAMPDQATGLRGFPSLLPMGQHPLGGAAQATPQGRSPAQLGLLPAPGGGGGSGLAHSPQALGAATGGGGGSGWAPPEAPPELRRSHLAATLGESQVSISRPITSATYMTRLHVTQQMASDLLPLAEPGSEAALQQPTTRVGPGTAAAGAAGPPGSAGRGNPGVTRFTSLFKRRLTVYDEADRAFPIQVRTHTQPLLLRHCDAARPAFGSAACGRADRASFSTALTPRRPA